MPFLMLTLGQLVVIVAGGLDLSVGALVASTTVLGMTIMLQNPANILLGVAAMVGLALLAGTINGLLVVKANIDSFVATLGMSIVLEGLALVITPKPLAPSPKILRTIAHTDVLGVPYALFIIVAVVAVFAFLLKYTALGRRFFAVGDNPTGSFWAGLPVVSTKFASFIICSFMAVLTSLYMLGRTGAGDPVFGPGLELDAIACALIGGASLAGGTGSLAVFYQAFASGCGLEPAAHPAAGTLWSDTSTPGAHTFFKSTSWVIGRSMHWATAQPAGPMRAVKASRPRSFSAAWLAPLSRRPAASVRVTEPTTTV